MTKKRLKMANRGRYRREQRMTPTSEVRSARAPHRASTDESAAEFRAYLTNARQRMEPTATRVYATCWRTRRDERRGSPFPGCALPDSGRA